jgi:hypothetical protein
MPTKADRGIHKRKHKHICVGLAQCPIAFLGSRLSQVNRRKRWVVPCCLLVNKG